jgi:hypothetical protein
MINDDIITKTSAVSDDEVESITSSAAEEGSSIQSSVQHGSLRNLAHRETKAVSLSKILMVFVLFCATAIFSVTTHKYTKHQEDEEFQVRV